MQMFQEEELEANTDDNALNTEATEADAEAEQVEDGDSDESNDSDAGRDRAKHQIDRLKDENRKLKEQLKGGGTGSSQGSQAQVASPLVERTYLVANGYKEREVQEEVIRLASKFGMSVDQALEDEDIRFRAETIQKKLQASQASSRPTGKAGATRKDAQWYVDHNQLPDDPKMVTQVWDILAQRDR